MNEFQNLIQRETASQSLEQEGNLIAQQVSTQAPTAMRIVPTTLQQDPMFHQHRQQLGIEFAEEMFRDGTAPFVYMPMAFPELEQ